MRVPRAVAVLGKVLDLRVERPDGFVTLLKVRRDMCADESKKKLWLLPPVRQKYGAVAGVDFRGAEKVYRLWHDLEPIGFAAASVRLGEDVYRGRVLTIGYRSDKWTGQDEDYTHSFRAPYPRLVQSGDVYRISGGALRVTARGVTG